MSALPESRPRFRGLWAIPAAFVATVVVATVMAVLELLAFSVVMGSTDPASLIADVTGWLLMLVGTVVLICATVIGLPIATLMHQIGAVHPGQGALVGAAAGGVVAGVVSLTVMQGSMALFFALFGVLPGAAAGAVCLWVAYRP